MLFNKENNTPRAHSLNDIVREAMPEAKLHAVEVRITLANDLTDVLVNAIQIERGY